MPSKPVATRFIKPFNSASEASQEDIPRIISTSRRAGTFVAINPFVSNVKSLPNNPYTLERAQRLQRNYLKLNAMGLATLSAGHLVLGIIYGDFLVAAFFAAFIVSGICYSSLFNRLRHGQYVLLGEFLILIGVVCSQFVLPQGAASAVLLFPMGVTLMAFSQTFLRGSGVFLLGVLLFLAFPFFGFSLATELKVPAILSFGLALIYSGAVLAYQLNKARKSVEYALSSLITNEKALAEEEEVLHRQQDILSGLNFKLGVDNKTLQKTLSKESETNQALEIELASQEELTKAIHRDLRQPLRTIVGASEELAGYFEQMPDAESVGPYLGFAIDGAKRMTRMLDDLLDYTSGTPNQDVEEVNLSEIIETLEQDLSDLISRSDAKIIVEELPVVIGFSTQLTQLFQNLLTNALKFSRLGVSPEVHISAAEIQDKAGYFMVRVRDNGVGIPANQLDGVFGLFNRAHAEDGYEGSGVGLALCRRIALAHDGIISVASVEGEGTQFTISFPTDAIVERKEIYHEFTSEQVPYEHI